MRQEFINPIHLPPLTGMFLRRDFNFAMYLGFSLSNFLCEVFTFLQLTVLIVLLSLLFCWKLINYLHIVYGSMIVYCIPGSCLILHVGLYLVLNKIEKGLVS